MLVFLTRCVKYLRVSRGIIYIGKHFFMKNVSREVLLLGKAQYN